MPWTTIAEAFDGGVPEEICNPTLAILDERLRDLVKEFRDRYHVNLTDRARWRERQWVCC
jgi:hypothetical protein